MLESSMSSSFLLTVRTGPLYSVQMEHSSPYLEPANGTAITSAVAVPSQSEIDLMSMSQRLEVLQMQIASLQIHMQEHCVKIAELENAKARFENALAGFGKLIFGGNPMSKMLLASMPKEAQEKVKAFINGNS